MRGLRFYCALGTLRDGTRGGDLWRTVEVVNDKCGPAADYAKYLGGAFYFDFKFADYCQRVLEEIVKLERGEIEKTGWAGNAFFTDIYPDRVEIEHQQFAGHPDWPLWTCTLLEYKAALEGWKRFLEMPVSTASEVIVELPTL